MGTFLNSLDMGSDGQRPRLAPAENLFYASLRVRTTQKAMQRITVRFLLLFALLGTFLPLAQAAMPAPLHACCVRKTGHCHESGSADSTQLVIGAKVCCIHDCCRAVTTSQWAHPQPRMTATSAPNVVARVTDSSPSTTAAGPAPFQSTRAPPQVLSA
jgi:hypothetical protein